MKWFWSHRFSLARAAQRAGWTVYVCAPQADLDERLSKEGFIPAGLPPLHFRNGPMSAFFARSALRRILRRVKPHVVHAITIAMAFLTGLSLPEVRRPRVVYTIAGLGLLFSSTGSTPLVLRSLLGPLLSRSFRRADRVIFQNSDDQRTLADLGWVRPERSALIPGSGVDTARFKPIPGPATPEPLVVMPTRLLVEKGVYVFAEMARILRSRGIQARCCIAGGVEGVSPRELTAEDMRRITASGTVEWLGRVEDMPELYRKATLIVYPSYYREGIPKVLLEAAASGKAVVTTDHPGCRDAVVDQRTGILVPVKDPLLCANAVEKLLTDEHFRRELEREARSTAVDRFDEKIVNSHTLLDYGPGELGGE
jgi:glycosyltransferase involved in cell wall biosynthesis